MIDLRCGDCLAILPSLGKVDAVVSDPPWGVNADTDYSRFVPSAKCMAQHSSRNDFMPIDGDSTPFDPSAWLSFPRVALWGAHCFSGSLPIGRWLVWLKKRDHQFGSFMSDAELCWINKNPTKNRAPGVYAMRHVWSGLDRESERGITLHPTQKPVAIMLWTLKMAGIKPGMTVLDPYMGSGSTGVAAVQLGCDFIGIEVDPVYFAVAQRRISKAANATPLLTMIERRQEVAESMPLFPVAH